MKIIICEDDPKQLERMQTIINNYIMIEEKKCLLNLQHVIHMNYWITLNLQMI